MAKISCPKCNTLVDKAGFSAWQIFAAILLFPIGLLALLAGTKRTECHNCGYKWHASRTLYII